MRVVFDTNVLLSANFAPGVCQNLLDYCLVSDSFQVILSKHIYDEFSEHAKDKFKAQPAKIEKVISLLQKRCEFVEPAQVPREAFADLDDLPVLGTGIAGKADVIVTGDRELQRLGSYQGIRILSPRSLYDQIRERRSAD